MTGAQQPGGTFTLPNTDITLNRVGFGAMQLAGPGVWGPPKDPAAAADVLREAIALGVDHIDTGDFYGPHTVNQLIHKTLHPYPENLTIVTKVGAKRGDDKSWQGAGSKEELVSAVQDNLRNLGLDVLDVVNLRIFGHGLTQDSIGERMEVMADLQRQGLIRHIGLSNVTSKQVAEARAVAPVVCVQNEYNIAHRQDDALIDELAAAGIAYMPFFPLGGFTPLQSSELNAVAAEAGVTPMQVALAWLLQRAPNIMLIPGTSSVAHLRENMQAGEIGLSPEAVARLDAIVGAGQVRKHAVG